MPSFWYQLSVCTENEKRYILKLWGYMSRLLRQLYEGYHHKLLMRAYQKLGDMETAKDLVQEVIAKVLAQIRKHPGRFEIMTEAELLAYVNRSLENAIIDYYRKRDTEKRKLQEYMDQHILETTGKRALDERVVDREEDRRVLQSCLKILSDEELMLMRDVCHYNLPYKVLAEEQGISVWALKQRISRIRKRLRKAKEGLQA